MVINLTTGQILNGFLKKNSVLFLNTTGTGTVKLTKDTGEFEILNFKSINDTNREFSRYHTDVDIEIYAENGTAEITSDGFVKESLVTINGTGDGVIEEGGNAGGFSNIATQSVTDGSEVSITATSNNANLISKTTQYGMSAFNEGGGGRFYAQSILSASNDNVSTSAQAVAWESGFEESVTIWGDESLSKPALYQNSITLSDDITGESVVVSDVIYASPTNTSAVKVITANAGLGSIAKLENNLTSDSSFVEVSVSDGVQTLSSAKLISDVAGGPTIEFTGTALEAPGVEAPTLGSNAPFASMQITKWIKVNTDGVIGYLPVFAPPI